MFFNHLNKNTIRKLLLIKGCVFTLVLLICLTGTIAALGQFFPYFPFSQPYFPVFSNTYLNNYIGFSPFNGFNPYITGYNAFPAYNALTSFNALNTPPFYPQASVSGGLIPFGSIYTNPLAFPYSAAAYFAAAVIPADVSGTWAGQWISTYLTAGIITGELSMTLAQSDVNVTGTSVFLLNKILKYGAYVIGTVEGNVLTLNSTVVTSATGTMTFDVTIIATVNDVNMEGTYEVINLVTGLITEQGTFTATRI